MSRRLQENIVACALLGIFVVAIVLSTGFSPRARVVPLPIATIGAVVMLVQLAVQNLVAAGTMKVDALEFLTGKAKSRVVESDVSEQSPDTGQTQRELIAVGFVLLLMAMVIFIGPLAAIFLFSAGYMGIKRQYGWPWSIAFAAAFALSVYVLFGLILGVQVDHTEFSLVPGL